MKARARKDSPVAQDSYPLMIVDDSTMMRRIIADMVDAIAGVQLVGEAANGAEALALLPSLQPDLILLDIEMPVMDGLTFLHEARLKTDARIIVISSIAQLGSESAVKALDLGAHDIVPKPSGVLSRDMQGQQSDALRRAIEESLLSREPRQEGNL